ncbi:MAG: hypothetical protein CVU24_17995 [Betaproteobacteria bacterium HGW-Betaproteobacteria-18]|jgi:hypothetical protein|nr:MAG: hypothetical protein CVU73_11095 [Deltaproteobacteria bacterium HGW-Deltaproteobacteria-8]PKO57987.1 MAG: hypothetical protein CVU24_17995 [Betaproteobacteria bacterium HGW-Betaproteobacteria-18]
MTKVTVNPTPSEQIVKAASADVLVTDKRGRSFKLKKPGVLAQFRLVEALGDVAKNEVYMGMVLPLIFIVAIDDDPVVQPASKLQVEALIQRLDEDGIEAVMNGVQEHFGQADPAASKKKSEG